MLDRKEIIEPVIVRGTRDFTPQQMVRRNRVMSVMREVFERFGYTPLETPILSPAETIMGKYGEEGDQLTYTFTDRGDRKLALPYDLTVPFARYFAANYRELPIPFKRYQMQRVWRAERPQKGRLREFYQCDIDIIGTKDLMCEVEAAKVIATVFDALGIKNITIKCNSRRLLNDVLRAMEVSDELVVPTIRIIDKLDKIGLDAVVAELSELGVTRAVELMQALSPGESNEQTLRNLAAYDTGELQEFLQLSADAGVADGVIMIDPTLARGLDYYTGIIIETISADSDFGTICAGGRYDNLTGAFSKENFSGMGVSFGFERIMLLIEEQGLLAEDAALTRVLVTRFDEASKSDSLRLYAALTDAGIPAEIYLGSDKLGQQIKYADKKNIPAVAIIGPGEKINGTVTIKWLQSGEQTEISQDAIVTALQTS